LYVRNSYYGNTVLGKELDLKALRGGKAIQTKHAWAMLWTNIGHVQHHMAFLKQTVRYPTGLPHAPLLSMPTTLTEQLEIAAHVVFLLNLVFCVAFGAASAAATAPAGVAAPPLPHTN